MADQKNLSFMNAKVLEEKLTALEKARTWTPRVISKLEALINDPDDFALLRVNPIRFGTDKGVTEREAIDLFLYAAKLGIFKMEWQLICPNCGDTVESFGALSSVHSHYYCQICRLETEVNLDDYIQISFTIMPVIRDIKFHHPDDLSVEDFYFKYHFNQTARFPNGPTFLEAGAKFCKGVSYLQPAEKKRFEVMDATEGVFLGHDLICNAGFTIAVTGAKKDEVQTVRAVLREGKFILTHTEVAPGKVVIEVENAMVVRESILLLLLPPDKPTVALIFDPFLTGNKLLNSQTFRDLYKSETVDGIGVRDLTLVFTDLKGSTAMYERIGDLKAFSLVQQHFDRLGKAIAANNGAIVKTIGDAIMASFEKPTDAVRASAEMLKEIEAFNHENGDKEIILKVGIHRGASIAVTLNERLDYFGQTVNIAARVQGLADAEEIYMTNDVYASKGVADILKGLDVSSEMATLKGIQKTMKVYRVTHPGMEKTRRSEKKALAGASSGSGLGFVKMLLLAAVLAAGVGAAFYFTVYIPDQQTKMVQAQQLQVANEKLQAIEKAKKDQAAAEKAKLEAEAKVPNCPAILPLLDKARKITPVGSYLSYLAMRRVASLPGSGFKLADGWQKFKKFGLFSGEPILASTAKDELLQAFGDKDFGEGQFVKTSKGYTVTVTFGGSHLEKTYSKTFKKNGLHLVSDWMATSLLDWMGVELTADQRTYLSKPLYDNDADLARGPKLEGIFHASETQVPASSGAGIAKAK
jgi:class 3 adenylate cyclase